MVPIENGVAKMHLITCFTDALKQSITEKRGGSWSCAASTTIEAHPVPVEHSESLGMQIHLRGTLHGVLHIEVARKTAQSLLSLDESDRLYEAWQQVMEGLILRLPKRAIDTGMFAFSVESCRLTEPSKESTLIGQIELVEAGGSPCILHVLADTELVESFQVAEWSVSQTAAKHTEQPAVTPELKRVIDVPLTVTLRFGQRSMRLREVLELNTGALVELDRQVEDPVDLILDERVIARGEVVIVDGNYGLRVTEIVERPQTVVF